MKPANFPGRKANRKQTADVRASGLSMDRSSRAPEIADMTIRYGANGRHANGTAREDAEPRKSGKPGVRP